jgi:hypothetical protein
MLFVPRQVRLASLPAAPAAAAMAKEEAKKEKKSKSKTSATSKTSPAPYARVLAAVAAFLESSGLPRTLAALQSEANLEVYHRTPTLSYAYASACRVAISVQDYQADFAVPRETLGGRRR